jgi:hypothetical protein
MEGRVLLGLSLLKVRRDILSTLLLIFVIASSTLAFILIPSLSTNLDSGIKAYSNQVATYIVVYENYRSAYVQACQTGDTVCQLLPPDLLQQMKSLPGVEAYYFAITNITWMISAANLTVVVTAAPPGSGSSNLSITTLRQELVCGVLGNGNYPPSLVQLSSGRLPATGTPEFVVLSTVIVQNPFIEMREGNNYNFSFSWGPYPGSDLNFSATLVGVETFNPVFPRIDVLFDSTYIKNLLGPTLYNETFGGNGANVVILKAKSLSDVQSIANETGALLANYSYYTMTYDQAGIANFQGFEAQTSPLYLFLSIVAMVSAAAAAGFVFYLGIGRREWEAGLLVTEGWSWTDLTKYFSYYYLPITCVAWGVATALSFVIGPVIAFKFAVYGTTLVFSASPQLDYILSSLAVMLSLSFVVSWLGVRRLRRKGLDEILREM